MTNDATVSPGYDGSHVERRSPVSPYRDGVWTAEGLDAHEKLVALCFANHFSVGPEGVTAWVTTARLMEQCHLSKGKVGKVVAALVAAGWLVPMGPRPQHRQIIVYRLTVPRSRPCRPAVDGARVRGTNGRYVTKTGPRHGPVRDVDRSMDGAETGPQMDPEPVHGWSETGPPRGPDSLGLSKDSHQDSPRVRALDLVGATPEEEKILIEKITKSNPNIGNLPAYLAAMHRSGDLAKLLHAVRAETRTAVTRSAVAAARQRPPCKHGDPGGDQIHPATGEPLCPLCRLAAQKQPPPPQPDPPPRGGRPAPLAAAASPPAEDLPPNVIPFRPRTTPRRSA